MMLDRDTCVPWSVCVWGLVVDLKELSREDKRRGSLELVLAAMRGPSKEGIGSSLVGLR